MGNYGKRDNGVRESAYPPVHEKPAEAFDFRRLDMLWERCPQYREQTVFTTLDALLEEHESYRKDFEELRAEYEENGYDRFLIQLSWSDLAYRQATRRLLEAAEPEAPNPYVDAFLSQFDFIDTDKEAVFLFPESYLSQFFVIMDVCSRAKVLRPVKNLFPDEERLHWLAVFDKRRMDDVLLMFHLLYTNTTEDLYGGYSLYDYPLSWYQSHLREGGTVLRSPYLPDRLAKFQGNIPYHHNPAKTVFVRRNIAHILSCGYFSSELSFFEALTRRIMPLLQWWYTDIALYEEKEGFRSDWRMERTRIRTRLTADGVIQPKWKHELTLFTEVRKLYPDTLYQYRPEWLGRQSLDLFIPSLSTAIEYQGIQHYRPVEFFGGEEALEQRRVLDEQKRTLCEEHGVRLIEWPYSVDPTAAGIRSVLSSPDALFPDH